MRIVSVIGTRPNFIKMAPVIAAIGRRMPEVEHVLVHTGQHYDRLMSDIFFEELALAPPDVMLEVGSGSHAMQTAKVMERLEPVLTAAPTDLLVVPGDVNSTLAAALVASKLLIPIAHIESGLRSFDRTMPEETNRILTDAVSDLLFIHSSEGVDNLAREGADPEKLHLVGNTMIDSLVAVESRFREIGAAHRLGLRPGNYLLVTLHRPALVDGPLLPTVIRALNRLSATLPVVFPIHPRTRSMLGSVEVAAGLHIVDPVGYLDFLSLQADAAAVLTDSGGVQEETTYLGVPCFTLRDNTERPVTIRCGTNTLLGLDPGGIDDILMRLARSREPEQPQRPPLWDGKAADRVVDVLLATLAAGEPQAPAETRVRPVSAAVGVGELRLDITTHDTHVDVIALGELGLGQAEDLFDAVPAEAAIVLVDLGGVSFVDSIGLRVLIVTTQRLAREGARVALCALQPQALQILAVTGTAELFELHASREQALRAMLLSA